MLGCQRGSQDVQGSRLTPQAEAQKGLQCMASEAAVYWLANCTLLGMSHLDLGSQVLEMRDSTMLLKLFQVMPQALWQGC